MQGNQTWAWLIFHPCNTVLRHHKKSGCWHAPGTGGDRVFENCARQVVEKEGYENVLAFFEAMVQYYPTTARANLLRFKALGLEGQELSK